MTERRTNSRVELDSYVQDKEESVLFALVPSLPCRFWLVG
jgi:hypothetical protein